MATLSFRRIVNAGRLRILRTPISVREKNEGPLFYCSRLRYFGGCGSGDDEYRGPGGLTASELFKKVQESAGRDREYAETIMEELHTEWEATEKDTSGTEKHIIEENPSDMSVRELRDVLDANSVDHSDYFEKADLIQLVRDLTGR